MKPIRLDQGDAIGLVHPFVDAHTLGLSAVGQLLEDCGYQAIVAGEAICRAVETPHQPNGLAELSDWIEKNRIKHLGFSYRLDPASGFAAFDLLVHVLRGQHLLAESGGPIRGLYFAGLPSTCARVAASFGTRVQVFIGDETSRETLVRFGVPENRIPREIIEQDRYEQDRLTQGKLVLESGLPDQVLPASRSSYSTFGTRSDSLVDRLDHGWANGLPPLMRAHVGPYAPDRLAAVKEYTSWCRELAGEGLLDVLSIGTSQLTQAAFGMDWEGQPNGGGVPIQNEDEYREVYEASRPMLVRTYAGTSRVPHMARVHERAINIAWHALSFWWFSKIDGRGPNSVRDNLEEHFETMAIIAKAGKPFEPNIPHHFAFRGSDDVTYVASAVLAARAAKTAGIRTFVLQNMMNTPRVTSGIQDLVKARVMLGFVRELEDRRFRVVYQPRAGLDYFSPDPQKAKTQLAAVTALMDDVEPLRDRSPDVIHVVSYSEGYELANPQVVNESIRITRASLDEHRRLRAAGQIAPPSDYAAIGPKVSSLTEQVRTLITAMEKAIPNLYSPKGLYAALWAGFLPVPELWECRDEFRNATAWRTRVKNGSVQVVDQLNQPIPIEERVKVATENTLAGSRSGPDYRRNES